MHITTLGQGPHLVLIHGWAMHSGIFAALLSHLAARHTVHCVDLPGHGLSPERHGALDALHCVERIAAATPPAVWIGWSLGGLIALTAAQQPATRVRGLASIAASPRFVSGPDWSHAVAHSVFEKFGADLQRDYRATLDRFLALEVHGSDRALSELRELRARVFEHGEPALHVLEDGLRILADSDLRAGLAQLAMPSLWLAGARDRLIPWQAMHWAQQQCPQSTFVRIPGGGHAPFLGHPEETLAALDEFLARVQH